MFLRLVLSLVLVATYLGVCHGVVDYACNVGHRDYTFCDKSLSIETRAKNLVELLQIDEKIGLLVNDASAVSRLGIPSYEWWSEALHGVADSPGVDFNGTIPAATSFPQPILTAASFNVTLFNKIGQVISTEGRAFHNAGQAGLTFWTPNINIVRDPRWGRGQETPGEDPHLSSMYAEYFVRGLQEDGDYDGNGTRPAPTKLKVSACCKHFTAYDLDQWNGIQRYGFDALVTEQDLDDSFNPPFEACIRKGGASALMCSYNSVNGKPTCADPALLTTLARDTWGFNGYIVSDCDAVHTITFDHHYADSEHAVADVLKAGMDLNCGDTLGNYTGAALARNLISEADIDTALIRSFAVQFRLGLFDGNPADLEYGSLGADDVCTNAHKDLALEAALQGIVLLKNDDNALPFSRTTVQSLAVIGPNANDDIYTMVGNYAGNPCIYVTPLQGLTAYADSVIYVAGCATTGCNTSLDIGGAADAAAKADATILVVGMAQEQEREAIDRSGLYLPGSQIELILEVAAKAKGPVVLVVMSGGSLDISFAKNAENISAILWIGYPGQAGGDALAKIVFGERNPGGRLPVTWYPEELTEWPMTKMNMRPNSTTGYPGRTYRFYTGNPVYEFGAGMSYSNFTRTITGGPKTIVSNVSKDVQLCSVDPFTVDVDVTNTEKTRDGSDVILLYVRPPNAGIGGLPLKQLIAFKRMDVKAGATEAVSFLVEPCKHFLTTQTGGVGAVLVGDYTIFVNFDDEGEALRVEVKEV